MKKLICFFSILTSLICCEKKNTNKLEKNKMMYDINKYIFPEAKDVTTSNFVEKLNSQIKHYDSEPIYYFRLNKQNCLVELYINDVSIFDDYEISNYITPIEIGHILKSGSQKVTVKMYPIGNLNNESWGKTDAKPTTHLTEDSQVAISIISIDEKGNKGLDDEKLITKQMSPKDATGKEVYEFSFTFDAVVPYEFEGWNKGQDLRKLNQNLVRNKALEFYKMVGEIHMNKDVNSWLKLNYPSDIRIKSAFFRDKQNLQETLTEYENIFKGVDFTVNPIKDYKMDYMANGKLLMLITNNMKSEYRGGGALYLAHSGGFYLPSITLFLPEGRDLATQGFMMWK